MNYFDQVATIWNSNTQANRTFEIYTKLQRYLPHQKELQALEIGSGDGLFASLLIENFSTIDGVDTSENMRKVAESRIRKSNIKNVTFYPTIPLNKTYDIIYSLTAFHHIINLESTLKNLRSKLNPSGHFYLMDLTKVPPSFHDDFMDFKGYHGFEQEEITSLLLHAGFNPIHYEIIWKGKRKEVDFSIFLLEAK